MLCLEIIGNSKAIRLFGLVGRINLGLVSSCLGPRILGDQGGSWSFVELAKLLKRLVDETGIEPVTSSLRTRRKI